MIPHFQATFKQRNGMENTSHMDNEYNKTHKHGVLTYRQATEADALYIAQHLRSEDRTEVILSNGADVEETLLKSFRASEECIVACVSGIPACIFGVASVDNSLGTPWMLATKVVTLFKRELLVDASAWLLEIKPRYSLLYNFVHSENETAKAWLKRLGFTLGLECPQYGAAKAPFTYFDMKGTLCVPPQLA